MLVYKKDIYDDIIWNNYEKLSEDDARLMDLDTPQLDLAVYRFLNANETFYTDIYPAMFSTGICKIATEMLFGKTQVANHVVQNLFKAIANDSELTDRDDLWLTEASLYIDHHIEMKNFANELKNDIYLYCESCIESDLFERMAYLIQEDKELRGYDG